MDARIRVTKVLAEQLGWSVNERLSVMVGLKGGDDDGKILLRPEANGAFRLSRPAQSETSYVLTSRMIPLPPGLKLKADYTIEEGNCLCLKIY